MIGRGVAVARRAGAAALGSAVDAGAVVARFEHHYAQTVGTAAELYPSVREAWRGSPRASCRSPSSPTSRATSPTAARPARVRAAFAAVVAGDDGWPKKPAGDMIVAACTQMASRLEETLMLGDSANDVLAARAAGCPVWCVPYGYNEGRPVESLGCDRIVASVARPPRSVLAPAERRGRGVRVREKRVRGAADFRYLRGSLSPPGDLHS
jgi:phosphoglycolate phosphatase